MNLQEKEDMQFIINGRTFNTSTSQTVAINRGENTPDIHGYGSKDMVRYEDTLYRTQKGNFFLHSHFSTKRNNKGKPIIEAEAVELTPEKALLWISDTGAIIIDPDGINLPDEA